MKGFKDSVSVATPNSFPHNLSHRVDTTCDLFQFRPVFCEEMYPTDHFKVSVADYFRAEPLAGPVYAKYNKKYSAFFVPYRILWDKWSDFLTGGSNGRLEFNVPFFDFGNLAEVAINTYLKAKLDGNLHEKAVYRNMLDFWSDLGVPIDWIFEIEDINDIRSEAYEFNFPLLRFLACRAVWFDWFRDQNLIGDDLRDLYCPKSFSSSGHYYPDLNEDAYFDCDFEADTLLMPLPVSAEKDYFTTAMTEPQRGGAAFVPVQLPSEDLNTQLQPLANYTGNVSISSDGKVYNSQRSVSGATDIIGMFDYNATRVAKGLQRYCELNGVAGGADLQQLLAHWGTAPNPQVFQRSTYIGSFSDDFNPTEVVSPSDTSAGSLAGEVSTRVNAAGHGEFEYTANEHGFFIIVQTLRPENSYIGGVRRECLHGVLGNGRFDFGTSELENTGFQPQYNYELCSMIFHADLAERTDLFKARGYVPRYAELKRSFNRCTGQMSTDMFKNLRCCRDYGRYVQVEDIDLFQNTDFTMVYGYPQDFPYDLMFAVEDPMLDHFQGWIQFFVECNRPFHAFAAPLIEDAKGDDVRLPYAGVRM